MTHIFVLMVITFGTAEGIGPSHMNAPPNVVIKNFPSMKACEAVAATLIRMHDGVSPPAKDRLMTRMASVRPPRTG
jgi:hypothetical protein